MQLEGKLYSYQKIIRRQNKRKFSINCHGEHNWTRKFLLETSSDHTAALLLCSLLMLFAKRWPMSCTHANAYDRQRQPVASTFDREECHYCNCTRRFSYQQPNRRTMCQRKTTTTSTSTTTETTLMLLLLLLLPPIILLLLPRLFLMLHPPFPNSM